MPERRTTVVVDFQVGDIDIGDADVEIPVEVDAGDGAEETTEEIGNWQEGLEEIFGAAGAARVSGYFDSIVAGAQAAGAALSSWVGVILGAVIAKLAVMYARMTIAIKIFRQLGRIGQWAFQQLLAGAQKVTEALIRFAQQGVMLSVQALQAFTEATLQAADALTNRLQGFLETAIATFADFQQSIANTVTVMGEFGEEGMVMRRRVGSAMKQLTKDARIMATGAADAAYEIASAGFSQLNQVVDMTRGSIQLAEATLTDVVSTANSMVATMNQFNLTASESSRVANTFAAAISRSPATMEKLTRSLEYAGPIANSFGIGLEQTVAALMGFYKQGRSGSRAGTEFRIMLASLAKQTDKAREVLKGLGVDIDALQPGRTGIVGIIRAFEQLQERVGQMRTVESIYQAFPVRAASAMVALIGVGSDQIAGMQKQIVGTNTAFKMQRDQLMTLSGFWAKLVSLWENVYYDVLEGGLGPALEYAARMLRGLVAQAREAGVFEKFGQMLYRLIDPIYELIAAIGPELIPAIDKMLDALPAAIQRIANVVQRLIPTIVSAIQRLPALFADAVETIVPMVMEFATTAAPLLLDFAETVIPLLIEIIGKLGRVFTTFLKQNGDQIVSWFEFLLQTAMRLVSFLPTMLPLIQRIVDAFMRWGPWLARVAINLIPQLLNIVRQLLPVFARLAYSLLPLIVSGMQQIVAVIQSEGIAAFQQLASLIIAVAATAMKALPILMSIVKKAFTVIAVFLGVASDDWEGFGNTVLQVLKWLDENFYYVVRRIIDLLKDFMRNLSSLLRILHLLSKLIPVVFGPMLVLFEVLLAVFSVLEGIYGTILGLLWAIAKVVTVIWDAVGTAPDWLRNIQDYLGGATGNVFEGVLDTWQAMADIASFPEKVAHGFGKAADTAARFGDVLDRTHSTLGNMQNQQQQLSFGGPPVGAGGAGPAGGGGTAAANAPIGYAGGGNSYRYQLGPWYFNDFDQMQRAANEQFAKMEKDRQESDRLRGSGTGTPT